MFLIDNKVAYDHHKGIIFSLSDESNKVVLTAPAKKCLNIIIKHRPAVVSQSVLFEKVWENEGLSVNTNAFYQNISLIRRAFKKTGIDDEVIITVARHGIKFSERIVVSEMVMPSLSMIRSEEHCIVDRIPTSTEAVLPAAPVDIAKNTHIIRRLLKEHLFYIILFFSFFYLVAELLTHSPYNKGGYFDEYVFFAKVNNCDVYTNRHYERYDRIVATMNIEGVICHNSERVFYTSTSDSRKKSIFSCAIEHEKFVNCASYFINYTE